MAEPGRAVFLSYASQDAAAVRRIAEALRASGVEVWFDQNELVGGDAWDAKIRGQIASCALFVPVISAATQARREGYFRLEWRLAAQRTHMMSESVAFLLPVVIDETRDAEADVPAEFRAVQWTRLRPVGFGGQARDDAGLAAFCARVGKLLGGEGRDASPRRPSSEVDKMPGRLGETSLPTKASRPWLVPVILGVAAVAALAIWRPWRETAPPQLVLGSVPSQPSNPASAPVSNDKSLVVLPLENLSLDPENAFFTEGMHAEIIATLQRALPDLKIISRESALALKGSGSSLAEKARKVGVAHVITGSVRREGTEVRIQLELRRARDESQLWSQSYKEQTGKGVLAIQSDIADQVARVLQARERKGTYAGAQFMTANPEAYDLFLKASRILYADRSPSGRQKTIEGLEQALAIDPKFSSAAHLLTMAKITSFRDARDPALRLRYAQEAKRWAEEARRLLPGGAGDAALAAYYSQVEPDNARALALVANAVESLPNDGAAHNMMAVVLGRAGRGAETIEVYRRAIALDPLNQVFHGNLLTAFALLRRSREFAAAEADFVAVADPATSRRVLDAQHWRLSGRLPSTLDAYRGVQRADWLARARRHTEALPLIDAELSAATGSEVERWENLIWKCDMLRRLHWEPEAMAAAQAAQVGLEKINAEPEFDASVRDWRLAVTLARLGRADEAIAAGRRYASARSAENQILARWLRDIELAEICAYLGRPRECVELLTPLLRVPSGISVPMLKVDPVWDNVREDAGFKAILADPKNSAPL